MLHQEKTLNLKKLKRLIEEGVSSIPIDKTHKNAVLVIGDTGVGKTTILSFLARRKLVVKMVGLNPVLDSQDQTGLKIGHDKFSETTIPSKIIIDNMVFFDCSGFKDNRGQEFEISNSFFIQRLFDLYTNIKILLMIDQSSITETRADKLPKLIKNLLKAFDNLKDIQDGVILLINRAKPEYTQDDYSKQLLKMVQLKSEQYMFTKQQGQFVQFLVKNKRICLFKQAQKQHLHKQFEYKQENLRQLITDTNFVKSKHIKNIISQGAKLSIRDYMDRLSNIAEDKIESLCRDIIRELQHQGNNKFLNNLEDTLKFKQRLLLLVNQVKNTKNQSLLNVLNEVVSTENLLALQQDLTAVFFFKQIYDKSKAYFIGVKNKLISQLSFVINGLDHEIILLQKKQQQILNIKKQVQQLEQSKQQLKKQVDKNNQLRINYQQTISKLKDELYQVENQSVKKNTQLKQTYDVEIEALNNDLRELRLKYDDKSDDFELLQFENQSLRQQIEQISKINTENASINTSFSKASKYPDVHCPHFKNGGKCKHCIKAWQLQTKSKKSEQISQIN